MLQAANTENDNTNSIVGIALHNNDSALPIIVMRLINCNDISVVVLITLFFLFFK